MRKSSHEVSTSKALTHDRAASALDYRGTASTLMNPNLMKMQFQHQRTNKNLPQGAESLSKMSRAYNKTTSGKSREEDFESMSIEEIDCLIEKTQKEIEGALDIKRRILRHKMMTKKAKHKKLQPIEKQLTELREKIEKYEMIKD